MVTAKTEMSGSIGDTNLVGDFRHAEANPDMQAMREFLHKLEELMRSYRITKIDIGWNPFDFPREKTGG